MRRGRGAQRFETLNVQSDANGAAALDETPAADDADASRLLPAGFSLDTAQAAAVAIDDSGNATSLDRGALNDRFQAIGQGQFDPTTGQFAAGFAPGAAAVRSAPRQGDLQGQDRAAAGVADLPEAAAAAQVAVADSLSADAARAVRTRIREPSRTRSVARC